VLLGHNHGRPAEPQSILDGQDMNADGNGCLGEARDQADADPRRNHPEPGRPLAHRMNNARFGHRRPGPELRITLPALSILRQLGAEGR
jgi:hypothetical protein